MQGGSLSGGVQGAQVRARGDERAHFFDVPFTRRITKTQIEFCLIKFCC